MFKKSDTMSSEYCAQIVKIGQLESIENSDFLAKTMVGGAYQVVVGKNDVKEGDIMIYCKLETAINADFLSVNNQFELGERELNKNYAEVQALIDEGNTDEAKKRVGYFNKHGRVRIVKLRGCPSEGCLFPISAIAKWKPEVKDYDFEQCFVPNEEGVVEPFNFDTIGNDLFVKVYVPVTNQKAQARANKEGKRNRKLKRFDRLVDGQFRFHYDTNQLQDNIWRINPDTEITASVKVHGTSHIVGKVLVKIPKSATVPRKLANKRLEKELKNLYKQEFRFYWQKKRIKNRTAKIKDILNSQYKVDYGKITSSRTVIKNQYINQEAPKHNYYVPIKGNKDVWNEYGDMFYPYLINGMTVYSEIAGYTTGSNAMIQKGYDYGCQPGSNKIMPYRITITDENGNVDEWSVSEVYGWTLGLMQSHPDIKDRIMPINIVYEGTLGNLYPDLDVSEHWNEEALKRMKADKEHFGMEENEPMCKTKVPREGIVIRIKDDPRSEAFKLKTDAFKFREAKQVDAGEVDVEMQEGYGDN